MSCVSISVFFIVINLAPLVFIGVIIPKIKYQEKEIAASEGQQRNCTVLSNSGVIPDYVCKINGACHFNIIYQCDVCPFSSSQTLIYYPNISVPEQYPVNNIHPCWSQNFTHDIIVVWQRTEVDHNLLTIMFTSICLIVIINICSMVVLVAMYQRKRSKYVRINPWQGYIYIY